MEKKEVIQPDNRWRHAPKTSQRTGEQTDEQKAVDMAYQLLGARSTTDGQYERWSVEKKWRGLYDIAIEFVAPYGLEVFVYEKSVQNQDKVLHRVNFEPPHNPTPNDPNGKIVTISSRSLKSKADLPKDDPLLNMPKASEL